MLRIRAFGRRVLDCMLSNFSCFWCRLLTSVKKVAFSKNVFRNTNRVPNRLDPDQDHYSFGPGPEVIKLFFMLNSTVHKT